MSGFMVLFFSLILRVKSSFHLFFIPHPLQGAGQRALKSLVKTDLFSVISDQLIGIVTVTETDQSTMWHLGY